MKKISILFIIIIAVIGCSKKLTPAKTSTVAPPPVEEVSAVTVEEPKTAAVDLAAGKSIYEAKCGKCHALPVTTNFTSTRWIGIMDWMAPKARLSDAEKANALAYAQANAKP